ncbi:MAG: SIR2 family protein [Candidatus Electryonea clarkiae]|nr:SIR2 family protein [Candidatus Electryonea clarkiae]MDP8285621.1 SIR2 family protein [Candidatus Electryonea clarkiae]
MNVHDFISKYRNHPVLFIGTGISLRYLNNSYTWDNLLKYISVELKDNSEYYLDIKSRCEDDGIFAYDKIAQLLEHDFNDSLVKDRNGKFKDVNDYFYDQMNKGINLSRFKIYISNIHSCLDFKEEMKDEIAEFKKTRKNIGSIITTNYDSLVKNVFKFNPLIGNDILLSNPYGSVYKIHGCTTQPSKIIITENDYDLFENKYELIRAQLLSIFIHNPIIFLGYGIGDKNIKSLLKTIFTYVEFNSDEAQRIRANFLLVEFEKNSLSHEITEHDIDIEGFSTIRINKIKTDDFIEIYKSLSKLSLPVSAMDVRKVQRIVREIYSGGDIKVKITEDLDTLRNSDKIIAIGSMKTISYQYQTSSEMMSNYFNILDESNSQLLTLINKHTIHSSQYFPVYGFGQICSEIENIQKLQKQQSSNIENSFSKINENCKTSHSKIQDIIEDDSVTTSNKTNAILWSIMENKVTLGDTEEFLRNFNNSLKTGTNYRKLLCAYDLKKYKIIDEVFQI